MPCSVLVDERHIPLQIEVKLPMFPALLLDVVRILHRVQAKQPLKDLVEVFWAPVSWDVGGSVRRARLGDLEAGSRCVMCTTPAHQHFVLHFAQVVNIACLVQPVTSSCRLMVHTDCSSFEQCKYVYIS